MLRLHRSLKSRTGGKRFTYLLRSFIPSIGVDTIYDPRGNIESIEYEGSGGDSDILRILLDLLSHDINNHIYASMGYLELLESNIELDETKQRYMDNSIKEMNYISHLIENIRAIVKMRMEPFVGKAMDLNSVIDKAVERAQHHMDGRSIRIRRDLKRGPLMVSADSYIVDLFDQLFRNSLKYDDSKVVEVEIEHHMEDDRVTVSVSDRGPGMDDLRKSYVLGRFDRLVREGDFHGSGMGLSLVNEVTRRYGGKVRIEDRVKGDGTSGCKVLLNLPLARMNEVDTS